MSIKIGNVEFYAGPMEVGDPDDLEEVIINFIDGTSRKLEIAVQELDNIEIAKSIIRARERKALVQLVVEQDYLKEAIIKKEPWEKGGANESNREIMAAVLRYNIDFKCDYNKSIFHQKFIIRDSESVLTGSTNFTNTGTHKNLNHIIIIHDKETAKIYSREFKEIQKGRFGKFNEGHARAPDDLVVSNIPIRILFAPDHNPEMEIMK